MATTNRRGKGKKAEVNIDQFLSLSQQSTSSDDAQAGMIAVFEEQMKMASEKRRNEKGKKFLQAAKVELQDMTTATLEEAQTALYNMDATFSKFVIDYATIEDEIRTLWLLIRKEQEIMLGLAQKRLFANTEGAKVTEKGQIKGMARTKEACQDMRQIIESITSMASRDS